MEGRFLVRLAVRQFAGPGDVLVGRVICVLFVALDSEDGLLWKSQFCREIHTCSVKMI